MYECSLGTALKNIGRGRPPHIPQNSRFEPQRTPLNNYLLRRRKEGGRTQTTIKLGASTSGSVGGAISCFVRLFGHRIGSGRPAGPSFLQRIKAGAREIEKIFLHSTFLRHSAKDASLRLPVCSAPRPVRQEMSERLQVRYKIN